MGQEVDWIADADGDWSNGANWSTGSPPGPDDLVVINTAAAHTITVDQSATIAELNNYSDNITVVAPFTMLVGGFDNGAGTSVTTVDGSLTVKNAANFDTLDNEGTIVLGGTWYHGDYGTSEVSGIFSNDGTVKIKSGGILDIDGGGSSSAGGLNVSTNATLQFNEYYANTFVLTGGTLNGGGVVQEHLGALQIGAATSIDDTFELSGTLDCDAKTRVNSAFIASDT